jgi:hypothetical protein
MDEMKKPKIVVVGVGDGGSNVVDYLTNEITNDSVKFVKVGYHFKNENTKATEITLPNLRATKRSLEQICAHFESNGRVDELAKLMAMVRDGDELYLMISGTCMVSYSGFRLKRDGKIIMEY